MDLPPLSETVIGASIQNRPNSMVSGILEPTEDSLCSFDGLLVGRALVNAGTKNIPVRLLNLTRLPKRIRSGTQIATCSAVESVVAEMCCACEGSKKNGVSVMIVNCIVLVKVVKKKQCACDDGEMRCACEGSKKTVRL